MSILGLLIRFREVQASHISHDEQLIGRGIENVSDMCLTIDVANLTYNDTYSKVT